MKASPQSLWNLLSAKRRFRIPLYQRRYGWQQEHCAALWKDLVRVYNNPSETHYLGCLVVTVPNPDGFHDIVDGQQRLTSLTLLLRSIAYALSPQAGETLLSHLRGRQDGWWLEPQNWGDESDLQQFRRAMDLDVVAEDSFAKNLRYFQQAIAERPDVALTIEGVQNALSRISLAWVELDKDGPDSDDQAVVFEKMNAEGLDLKPHDLIRNRIFLLAAGSGASGNAAKASERQRDLFQNEWLHFEHLFERRNLNEMSHFFRDYLILKTGNDNIHAGRELPDEFKKFLRGHNGQSKFCSSEDVECLVNDLWRHAAAWCRVVQGRAFSGKDDATLRLNSALREFSLISSALVLPLATQLILDVSSKSICPENATRALESLARFNAISLLTGQMPRRLPSEIAQRAVDPASFAAELCTRWPDSFDWDSRLRETLLGQTMDADESSTDEGDNLEQTRDDEIPLYEKNESQAADVYHLNRRGLIFLLLKIHQTLMEEAGDTPMAFAEQGHTIEHIMPQTPSGEWEQTLPFHKSYLHSLGNLTLVGKSYNPKISNGPLDHKLPLYQNSSYTLTRSIPGEIRKALKGEDGRSYLMKLPTYFNQRARELTERAIKLLNPHNP